MRFSSHFFIVALCGATLVSAPSLALAQDAEEALPPLSGVNQFLGPMGSPPVSSQSSGHITLSAHLSDEAEAISSGLVWRVFSPEPDESGKLELIATSEGGTITFNLKPGVYLVHAAYGRAGATKRIRIGTEGKEEHFVLEAGGLKLDAVLVGGTRIPPEILRFSIYEADADATGERPLIIPDVQPNTVIRLNAGTYHIVSTYGSVNAVVRSDIRVEANELIEATVEHRAAELTMKLVREHGGEAIADTAWSVISESGETIRETVGAFASMVLAEGQYTIIAKNRDRLYQKDLIVIPGRNQDVELLPTDLITDAALDAVD